MDTPLYTTPAPLYLKIPAKIISYIFHPLFIPTYVFLLLVLQFPYEFANGMDAKQGVGMRTLIIFINTAFFPGFAVLLLKLLKFIDSIHMPTRKERIIPYVIVMFFYWWVYYLSRNFADQAIVLKSFFLGIFLCTAVALIVNNFIKISMHALGVGGMLAFIIISSFYYEQTSGGYISIVTLVTGLVCTSRFIVSDHTPREIYAGLFWGIATQCLAAWITL